LVIFDVDGTLVDSQAEIMAAMQIAFARDGGEPPPRANVLSIVGLSLPEAFAQLCPTADAARRARLIDGYRAAFADLRNRAGAGDSPLYPGAQAALERLHARDDILLAVATGKSVRGLERVIAAHGWGGYFVSLQTADDHPSKPHPAMVLAAMADAGVDRRRTAMVGDTRFDMQMARAAGVATIGVGWGYHAAATLDADVLIADFADLDAAIDTTTGDLR